MGVLWVQRVDGVWEVDFDSIETYLFSSFDLSRAEGRLLSLHVYQKGPKIPLSGRTRSKCWFSDEKRRKQICEGGAPRVREKTRTTSIPRDLTSLTPIGAQLKCEF